MPIKNFSITGINKVTGIEATVIISIPEISPNICILHTEFESPEAETQLYEYIATQRAFDPAAHLSTWLIVSRELEIQHISQFGN